MIVPVRTIINSQSSIIVEDPAVRILVVEGNAATLQVLKHYLEEWGHEVVLAQDGADAWRLFQDNEFFMVLTDWMLPGLSGLELVRNIRADPRPGHPFIILLTIRADTADLVEAIEAGADDFISKPFEQNELRARLQAGERIIRLQQDLLSRNRELEEANAKISEANQRMKEDLQIAANSQKAFLPTDLPAIPGVKFAWTFEPCEELAGDMFNVFRIDEEHVALYLLDVSGHGVSAALLAVSLSRILSPTMVQPSLLKERIPEPPGYRIVPPIEVAGLLNHQFASDASSNQFFTLIYGILNIRTRDLCYVSAGHPGPLFLAPGTNARFLAGGPPAIGIFENPVYQEHTVTLSPGDRLYFYSDGILEVLSANARPFEQDQLKLTLAQSQAFSLEESLSSLNTAVEEWRGGTELTDDISILAMEIEE